MKPISEKSNHEIIKHILSYLNLPPYSEKDLQQEIIISEYIRDCIYNQTMGNSIIENNDMGIYTGKIKNVLNQQLGAVWPLSNRSILKGLYSIESDTFEYLSTESIKNKLINLNLIGDIEYLGKGFWYPAPIRLVKIPNSDEVAILGGWPSRNIHRINSLSQGGLVRRVNAKNLFKSTKDNIKLWQNFENWIGWQPNEIIDWTKQQCSLAIKDGSSTLYSHENYDIFASFKSRMKGTWIRIEEFSEQMSNKIVYLCRTRDKKVTYFLGVFQNGEIIKEFPLKDKEVILWLRLGLKALHGKMNYGQWEGNKLKLYSVLPNSIERHLLLYSIKVKRPDGIVYYTSKEFRSSIELYLKKYKFYFKEIEG